MALTFNRPIAINFTMKSGAVVEFIDRQKILCATVIDTKQQKVRLLTETNREVAITARRVLHESDIIIDLSEGRDNTVRVLRGIAKRRDELAGSIDIKELWETLNKEQAWIDLPTITDLCFPKNPSSDHESAVMRTLFNNRQYFKFKNDRFFPNTEEQVEKNVAREKEIIRRSLLIKEGGDWLRRLLDNNDTSQHQPIFDEKAELLEILRSYYLFGKDSKEADLGRAILKRAEIEDTALLFSILLKTGVFEENENIDLYRYDIRVPFPDNVVKAASDLEMAVESGSFTTFLAQGRRDLTDLSMMTIDGASTLDFDDAISIEDHGDFYYLGVHITDVGHFMKKGNVIDEMVQDPFCKTYIPKREAVKRVIGGKEILFCSKECADRFESGAGK